MVPCRQSQEHSHMFTLQALVLNPDPGPSNHEGRLGLRLQKFMHVSLFHFQLIPLVQVRRLTTCSRTEYPIYALVEVQNYFYACSDDLSTLKCHFEKCPGSKIVFPEPYIQTSFFQHNHTKSGKETVNGGVQVITASQVQSIRCIQVAGHFAVPITER